MSANLVDRIGRLRRSTRTRRAGSGPVRQAFQAAPAAMAAGLVLEVLMTAFDTVRAPLQTGAAVAAIGLGSVVMFVIATARRSDGALLGAVLAAAGAVALAGLPQSRPDAAVVASASGVVLLAIAEAGGYAVDAADRTGRRNRPGLARAVWVTAVGVAGGAAGWLALGLRSGLSGYGDVALGLGVLAGACLIVLVGGLARAAVTSGPSVGGSAGGGGDAGRPHNAVTRLLPRAPSRRGRLPGRDATPAEGHHQDR